MLDRDGCEVEESSVPGLNAIQRAEGNGQKRRAPRHSPRCFVEMLLKLRAVDGTSFSELAYLTINALPSP